MLIDSNIIIYAAQPEYRQLRQFCIGQPHREPSHAPSRRFLMPGNHLAHNLREDGLCTVSSTTTQLRQFIAEHSPFVSAVSYVEVLGYHKLADEQRVLLEAFSSQRRCWLSRNPCLIRRLSCGNFAR